MADTKNILFELQGVTKTYGNTVALDNISLQIKAGQITSIYGPNGAGKSTLVKILCGVENVSNGKVFLNGTELSFNGYSDALKSGVSYMPQDFGLIPNLTGWENLKVPQNQLKNLFWYDVETSTLNNKGIEKSIDLNLSFFSNKVLDLTNYQKQTLAIYKAVSFESRVYIFDESTTNLNSKDFRKFANLLKDLKNRGISILFISHKIDEVFEVSDDIIFLRNGKLISQKDKGDADKKEIINLFLSKDKVPIQQSTDFSNFPPYHIDCKIKDGFELEFELPCGETITVETGDTSLDQQIGYIIYDCLNQNTSHKVGIIPGNRIAEGIFSNLSIKDNLIVNARQHGKKVIIENKEIEVLNHIAERLELKYNNWDQSINDLSGGNQQKIVFGRWMIADFDILILIEPTSGIDLKSKEIIHSTILEMASSGKSFILITSDQGEKLKLNAKNIGVTELC